MSKDRKVTQKGVVKESSELIKEREIAREGQEKWPKQPTENKRSLPTEESSDIPSKKS
jgi:hypothetical protein